MEWIAVYFAIGVVAGTLAGMLGVGGGGLIVPMMVAVFAAQEFPRAELLHLAVGTSMASIIFTSIASSRAHAKRGVLRWDIVRGMTPGRVEIHTLDGKVYTQETEHPYGHPGNPITHEDTVRKFRECAGKAAVPVQPADMDRIIDRVANLEKLKDVGEIARLLGPAA